MKLCIDCAHLEQEGDRYLPGGIGYNCTAVMGSIDPVSGKAMTIAPAATIRLSFFCGWHEARMFVPREPAT